MKREIVSHIKKRLVEGVRDETIINELRAKFPTDLNDDGIIASYMLFAKRQAPACTEYETTVGEFVAASLEAEAAKMPSSMKEKAEVLRKFADTYRRTQSKVIRVREISR